VDIAGMSITRADKNFAADNRALQIRAHIAWRIQETNPPAGYNPGNWLPDLRQVFISKSLQSSWKKLYFNFWHDFFTAFFSRVR